MRQLENSQTPVTAVSYNSGILLAADGPILRLWDEIKRIPLKSHRIFRSQQIHGIAISGSRALPEQAIVWGGKLLRIVNLDGFTSSELASIEQNKDLLELSGPILESPDWILDISVRPVETESCLAQDIKAVAITAHNDLLALNDSGGIRTLAAGSQCILYSAHLTWISPERLLIGSGSAFGEIIVWTYSWEDCGPIARTHHVFTGHEGSIFGIRISKPLINSTGQNIRVLSSCSDDRTIRVWDISDLSEQINEKDTIDHDTGFSPNPMVSMDQLHNHRCLASAMGHASRIWSLRYIYPPRSSVDDVPPVVRILSVGEDATCQTWDLVETHSRPSHDRVAYELRHADSALCHSGKHIWAIHVPSQAIGTECFQAISGGADGRIVTRRVLANKSRGAFVASQEWDSRDISGSPPQSTDLGSTVSKDGSISKIPRGDDRECFRGLTFVGSNQILTILNSGLVYLSSSRKEETRVLSVSSWQKLGDFPGLRGYSVSAATLDGHFAFFAGSTGTVYCYDHQSGTASQISKIDGKVAALFAQSTPPGTKYSGSLVTAYLGRNMAQIALFRRGVSGKLESFGECTIDSLTSPVTSAAFVDGKQNLLILGCRNGSISVFVAPIPPGEDQLEATFFSLKHTIEMAHGKETVTNVRWIPGYSEDLESLGSILSVGRDGTCCIHAINKELESSLVHKLSLPFGPNIEGLWINLNTSELFVYGFQGTKFLLYNITAFQEVLSINCGGAHRTWSFRPIINSSDTGKIGGSFAWTQASKLKASFISEPSYEIIQSGGHGREIKACAVAPVALPRSTTGPLIATGAEDTDIRLFKYTKGGTKGFTAVATLRKHDSGIQNLKWSSDGRYLFSSGGHLEFFIWRLEAVAILGIGVVCESVCPVEKRLSELRITAFEIEDMTALDDSLDGASETRANFLITLVYCNSIVKVNCSIFKTKPFADPEHRLFDIHHTEVLAIGPFLEQGYTHQHA